MKNKKKLIFLFIVLILISFAFYKIERISKNVDNLMIVAHPDDESLWGGNHSLREKYLVVCVTCGQNEIREKEFENAMKITNDKHKSLGFNDLVNGQKDDWSTSEEEIKKELNKIIKSKKWKKIVTHNPDGEYGHIHHMKTSKFVTELSDKNKLYYFDKYYQNNDNITEEKMSDYDLNRKENLLEVYTSQGRIVDNHRHTIMYENFINYYDWK